MIGEKKFDNNPVRFRCPDDGYIHGMKSIRIDGCGTGYTGYGTSTAVKYQVSFHTRTAT
ncbi:hypothetical protein DPMN_058562 [Dreissena polymorpha]|uniref:Uncharacterized protein n=1 Tax=Dreissena polymorpha TaxID=45954 RepID=A0A9D4HFK4_DREPO|nr:hypothetical protein DPMN_058562 [Dreissena polymorpha]